MPTETPQDSWTFLTNHSHVLLCLARDPKMRLRDVADLVGITERAVQKIVADLATAGVVSRVREGRRNHYIIHANARFRHPLESKHRISELIDLLVPRNGPSSRGEGV